MSDSEAQETIVHWLRRLGLNAIAATLLEAAGPLAYLGAQGLYMAAPLLGSFGDQAQIERLARALEQPETAAALARKLSEKA